MVDTAFAPPFTHCLTRPRAPCPRIAPARPSGPQPRTPPRRSAASPQPRAHRLTPRSSGSDDSLAPPRTERPASAAESEAVVREFWRVAASGRFSDATALFAEDAVYHDTLYPSPFDGRAAIDAHFRRLEPVLDGRFVFVLDAVAPAATGLVGARWHAETPRGRPIPFTRGASMYTIVLAGDEALFKEAWDFPETPLKTAGPVLAVARVATTVLRWFEQRM